MEDLSKLYDAVVEGKINEAGTFTRQALNTGIDAETILYRSLVPAMEEVGERS